MTKLFQLLKFPIILVVILWSLEIYERWMDISFTTWGILPRRIEGLKGIFTSPFIHSDFEHLLSNTFPLFTLSTIMVVFYKRVAVASFVIIYLLTGFIVWLFARDSYIVGASGVVYGLVSFVFFAGIFKRNIKSIVLSLLVLMVYSSFFGGILPQEERISWESHLFGALVGIFTAYLFKNVQEEDEQYVDVWQEEETAEYYFDRDIFAKTKAQRAEEERLRRIAETQARRQDDDWYQSRTW
jgi:membrane associated rhomboid family serine protease